VNSVTGEHYFSSKPEDMEKAKAGKELLEKAEAAIEKNKLRVERKRAAGKGRLKAPVEPELKVKKSIKLKLPTAATVEPQELVEKQKPKETKEDTALYDEFDEENSDSDEDDNVRKEYYFKHNSDESDYSDTYKGYINVFFELDINYDKFDDDFKSIMINKVLTHLFPGTKGISLKIIDYMKDPGTVSPKYLKVYLDKDDIVVGKESRVRKNTQSFYLAEATKYVIEKSRKAIKKEIKKAEE
jgi:hypothetical protein